MANDRMKCTVSGRTLTWDFGNADNQVGIDVSRLSPEIQQMGLIHGIRQKVQDAAALDYRQPDGSFRKPTLREKRQRMAEMIERLSNGSWFTEDRAEPSATGLLAALKALAESGIERYSAFEDLDADTFREWAERKAAAISAKNHVPTDRRAIYTALRKQPEVAEMLAKLAAPSGINVDDILAG